MHWTYFIMSTHIEALARARQQKIQVFGENPFKEGQKVTCFIISRRRREELTHSTTATES